ncbi:xanthine dehydrogenase molybdopterin binding subunit [Alicycliphilus sp. B1]|nr:xanthine dehydrogenase molybdopterin binding subunit [Alicycliphilus sp. B1]
MHDDPILCDGEIRYLGQPVFAVVARTREQARRAAALARQALRVEAAPPVLTPREAHARGQYVVPPMHLVRSSSGLDEAGIRARIAAAPHRLQGSLDVGGQEQFYLEGQISYAIPKEGNRHATSTAPPSTRARCSTWWRTPWACTRTRCRWNAGAWAGALAARSRSRPCSPAWPAWPRGCWRAR